MGCTETKKITLCAVCLNCCHNFSDMAFTLLAYEKCCLAIDKDCSTVINYKDKLAVNLISVKQWHLIDFLTDDSSVHCCLTVSFCYYQ